VAKNKLKEKLRQLLEVKLSSRRKVLRLEKKHGIRYVQWCEETLAWAKDKEDAE